MKRNNGFTLIELMITMVILGVLASVAYPSYVNHVYKARRADGHLSIMDMAQRLERCKTTSFTYVGCISSDEYSPEGHYLLSLPSTELSATSYHILAVPQGPQNDDKCGDLKLSESGEKFALGSADVSECW